MSRYLKDHSPFTCLGETLALEMIASTLYLTQREVTPDLETRGDLEGVSRKFLETKAIVMERVEDWNAFNAVLDLLIYGIVLFHNADDFVGFTTINVLLAKNPISVFLADVYYYLHTRNENKMGLVLCCAHLLYPWVMFHMP